MAQRRIREREVAGLQTVQHLVLAVGGEEYAVPLLEVGEIVAAGQLSPVPEAPPLLGGVLNLRGEPVALVDLAVALGGRSGPRSPESCALIVATMGGGPQAPVGLAVDAVSGVVGLAPEEITRVRRWGALVGVDFLQGMAHAPQGLLPILDLGRLLSSEDVRACVNAARSAAETRAARGEAE